MLNAIRRLFRKKLELPPARRRCDLTIIFAAANGEQKGIDDLLDCLKTYLRCDYEVVVADDCTDDGTYDRLLSAGCWVIRNPDREYLWGNDRTLRRAFHEAVRLFESPIYLKIDPDALLIRDGLEDALSEAFRADERLGLLGAYHVGWDGGRRDLSFWRERMLRYRHDLGRPFELALCNGYEAGDGVQGGAYALSRTCLRTIYEAGWLAGNDGYNPSNLRPTCIAEDSLIAMLTFAAGFRVGEIGGPGQPFAVKHIGLPMPPEELITSGSIVTHSVKYEDETSVRVREFFRLEREKFTSAHRAT